MEKHKIALFPLLLGLGLLIYSWFSSYPLSINFSGDVVFNHISPFYWVGLPLTLASLFLIGAFSRNHNLKCLMCVIAVLVIFSLSYFYFSLPTSDSQYFRGLNEYFIKTKSLDPSQYNHSYFQWPAFFLISDIVTSVSGLSLINVEFLLYAVIGSLLGIALYVYASKQHRKGGFLAVLAFFISMFYFINYQWAPFTLALGLLFVLFMLETQEKSSSMIITVIILFFTISIAHTFVALFFIIYFLAQTLVRRTKQYTTLFFLTSVTYLLVQFTIGGYWIEFNIQKIFQLPSEYSATASYTFNPISVPIDSIAQTVSRTVTIAVVLICLLGFLFMLIKRKLRAIDISIFLTGVAYSALGFFLFLLGNRAISILFIPLSLGAAYLFGTRLRPYLKGLFLIILILFVFLPIHTSCNSYIGSFVPFQTKDEYITAHFLLNNYDWTTDSVILAHAPIEVYLLSSVDVTKIGVTFETEFWSHFPTLASYDCILFSVGLVNSFLVHNYTTEEVISQGHLNIVYDNGFSKLAVKS